MKSIKSTKSMKTLLFSFWTLLCMAGLNGVVQAQNTNWISAEEYGAITFNGVSIDQILTESMSKEKVISLFGTPATFECTESSPAGCRFDYGNNRVGLNTEPSSYISNITIYDMSWSFTVKGVTFRVGDPVSKFYDAFGQGFKTFTSEQFPGKASTGFNTAINSYDSVFIDIDPQTNTIKSISYYVRT